jgi:tRNA G18 (ribose-2'-O)-methylase SpoU
MRNPTLSPVQAIGADPSSELARPHGALGLEFLLYGLQSPINIGMILRVAETYQFRVSIFDQHRVLDDPEKFGTINDFACGAVSRWGFRILSDEPDLIQMLEGRRLVSTSIDPEACALPTYRFRSGDLFALGNEYDGLPDTVVDRADTALHIPMPPGWTPKPKSRNPIDPTRKGPVARDGQPNLNVAMTAGILCYASMASRLAEDHLNASTESLTGSGDPRDCR